MNTPTLAADYTAGGKKHGNWLTIYKIVNGRRFPELEQRVTGKAEARRLAKLHSAQPWNF